MLIAEIQDGRRAIPQIGIVDQVDVSGMDIGLDREPLDDGIVRIVLQ
jgi:hypothetical protein